MRQQQVTVLPLGLRAWRKARGLSQEQLAIRSGVSAGLIALIETGRRQPALGNALEIAKALDVDLRAFAIVHVDVDALHATEGAA